MILNVNYSKNNDIEIRFKLLLIYIIKPFFFTGKDNRVKRYSINTSEPN